MTLRALNHERKKAPETLARLIAAHKQAWKSLRQRERERERFGNELGSRANLTEAVAAAARARKEIISFKPRSRQEAMIKLGYLLAVSVVTHIPISDDELAELSGTIARFKA